MEAFRGDRRDELEGRGFRRSLARLASVVVLAAGIMITSVGARAAGNASGSVELMSGNEASVLDTKLSIPVAGRTSLFFRNRSTADYASRVSPFTLLDLNLDMGGGFSLVYETQFTPQNTVSPIAGFGFFRKAGDLSMFVAPGITLRDETTVTTQVILRYAPLINRATRLLARLEMFSTEDKVGQLGTIGRARLGIERNGCNAGLAIDAGRFRGVGKTDRNIGVFLQKDF